MFIVCLWDSSPSSTAQGSCFLPENWGVGNVSFIKPNTQFCDEQDECDRSYSDCSILLISSSIRYTNISWQKYIPVSYMNCRSSRDAHRQQSRQHDQTGETPQIVFLTLPRLSDSLPDPPQTRIMRLLRILKMIRHFVGLQSLLYTLHQAWQELGLILILVRRPAPHTYHTSAGKIKKSDYMACILCQIWQIWHVWH